MIDNSLIDRIEDNVPVEDIDVFAKTPTTDLPTPGVDPVETNPKGGD